MGTQASALRQDKSGAKLDSQSVTLIVVHGLHAIASALSGTFIPAYLWKAKESFANIGWFCLSQYVVGGLIFWIAGKWVKEYNKMNALRLGVVLSGCFYFTVLMLGPSAYKWVVPIGILDGVALGLFWLSYNIVYFEVTEPGNRDRYNGIAGLLGAAAGIIAPWVSGYIITTLKQQRGYQVIFTSSLIILGIAVVCTFWLKHRQSSGTYEWLHGVKELRQRGNPWRRFTLAIMMQGLRDGVFMFLVGLTVYIATRNEQKLGNYALTISFVALISFWIVGKWLRPHRRKYGMLAGVLLLTAAIIPLFFGISYKTLLMFGIGTSLFMPLYIIPVTSSVFDLIGKNEQSVRKREEFIVLREIALTLGRTIGMIAYLVVLSRTRSPAAITWLLFAVGCMPIIGWFATRNLLNMTPDHGEERQNAKDRTIGNGANRGDAGRPH
ncbi:major facilitator superfamily MFS_1 [Paenibacillus curdlanolyticus YK9]|uniref:Major facilitator superfamily MFS_1 n=1 Tax=Paenibacillus curdlanolyticus YK9 TaxID=717606 RepID=E0I6G5_9BACL|nr:MFS transporter [Paenibacillus curdlanolyticus]EFM11631.1 major facilitator superfamily MFS_1 [Paenibacillus curdlanolyticus YK9]